MLPTKFRLFDKVDSEEKIFRNRPIKHKNCCDGHVLTNQDEMSNLYRWPSKDAAYQISVHLW